MFSSTSHSSTEKFNPLARKYYLDITAIVCERNIQMEQLFKSKNIGAWQMIVQVGAIYSIKPRHLIFSQKGNYYANYLILDYLLCHIYKNDIPPSVLSSAMAKKLQILQKLHHPSTEFGISESQDAAHALIADPEPSHHDETSETSQESSEYSLQPVGTQKPAVNKAEFPPRMSTPESLSEEGTAMSAILKMIQKLSKQQEETNVLVDVLTKRQERTEKSLKFYNIKDVKNAKRDMRRKVSRDEESSSDSEW